MASVSSVTLVGYLPRDCELRYTPKGNAVLSFTIPTDVGFGDRKDTMWWKCTMWGKRAENLSQYLKKKTMVQVMGVPSLEKWQTKEGQDRYQLACEVKELTLLGCGERADTIQKSDDAFAEAYASEEEEEIIVPIA